MTMTALEQGVYDPLPFIVDGKTYLLVFTFPAVAELESKIHRSMKVATDWYALTVAELPEALRAGLLKHHPAEAEELSRRICDTFGPERVGPIIDGLCAHNFPEATRRYQEVLADLMGKLQRGEALPNGPSVGVA
jgi:hypothetical protein